MKPYNPFMLIAGMATSAVLLIGGPALATEFICETASATQHRLGVHSQSIVVISRAHDSGSCNFSVGGFPAAGPAEWNLDLALGDHRVSPLSGEDLIYSLLLRASEDIPPNDLATVLLSAGGYGPSQNHVTHGSVVDFAAEFLTDRSGCLSLMEFAGGDIEMLENGFCGYLAVGTGRNGGAMAAALAEAGIALAPEFPEGAGEYLYNYFVYSLDTGSARIAAFFPTED